MTKFLAALILLFSFALPVLAKTEHCPDGWASKVETGDMNSVVLDLGTQFCVKGSTGASDVLIANGQTNLYDYLDSGHDVSYYVVYTTPKEAPSPSLAPSASPEESDAPSGAPSASPRAEPSDDPSIPPPPPPSSPDVKPSPEPDKTLPPTDTEG